MGDMPGNAPSRRRVLITGVSRFLGLRLAKRLEDDEAVELVVGVDLDEPPMPVKGLEFIRADITSPLIARVLESTNVDTVVHTNIASSPGRFGGRSQMKENNVIGTMQLLAAAQRAERVTKVVVKSSTAVYGSGAGEPSLIPEDHASRQVYLSGYAKDCADAETYARDFGRRRRDVDLVIVRAQAVIGPTVRTAMTDYLSLPVVPTALGYDPRLQFLHEEDAVEAMYDAMVSSPRGIFNVAGDGVVFLSQALRLLGRPQIPVVLPLAQPTAQVLRSVGVVDFPTDQLRLLLYGRVVDTQRAKQSLGFTPRYTTIEALLDFKNGRDADFSLQYQRRPDWERDLIEYLRVTDRARESV